VRSARQAIFSGAGSARDITFRVRYNAAPVAEDTASFGRGGRGRGVCGAPSRYDCSVWRQAGKRTPMELVFLRHGLAADREEWKGTDEDRPLTAEGVDRTKEVVRGLRALKVRPDAILSSPLLRARETAEIAKKGLITDAKVELADGCPRSLTVSPVLFLHLVPARQVQFPGQPEELVPVAVIAQGALEPFERGHHSGIPPARLESDLRLVPERLDQQTQPMEFLARGLRRQAAQGCIQTHGTIPAERGEALSQKSGGAAHPGDRQSGQSRPDYFRIAGARHGQPLLPYRHGTAGLIGD